MIQAEVKRLHSPDVYDLATYVPDDPENFAFLLQVMVGSAGADGEDSFDVIVCTPRWLSDRLLPTKIMLGRHHLLVKQYDYTRLLQFLISFASGCRGATWEEVALRLGRLGKWEFEDYRELEDRR
jgi:hypothetical protein